VPTALCRVPNGIRPAVMMGTERGTLALFAQAQVRWNQDDASQDFRPEA
jgi:hypothetical protein